MARPLSRPLLLIASLLVPQLAIAAGQSADDTAVVETSATPGDSPEADDEKEPAEAASTESNEGEAAPADATPFDTESAPPPMAAAVDDNATDDEGAADASGPVDDETAAQGAKNGKAKDGEAKDGEAKEDEGNLVPGQFGLVAGARKWAFRGSSLTVRNAASALTFAPDAELTYNPEYVVTMSLSPIIWFGDIVNIAGYVDVSRDLTENDWTTYSGEAYLSDMWLSLRATNFYTIPFVDIGLSAALSGRLPTSKMSWAETMLGGAGASFTAFRGFDLLSGLALGYSVAGWKFFHRYTTGEVADSLSDGRCVNLEFCGIFASTGVRNTEWSLSHRVFASLSFTPWLGAFASGQVVNALLYPHKGTDRRVTFFPDELGGPSNVDTRHLTMVSTAVFVTPHPAITIFAGTSTAHPQLRPDGKYRVPGLNRFTQLYVDLQFNMGGIADLIAD